MLINRQLPQPNKSERGLSAATTNGYLGILINNFKISIYLTLIMVRFDYFIIIYFSDLYKFDSMENWINLTNRMDPKSGFLFGSLFRETMVSIRHYGISIQVWMAKQVWMTNQAWMAICMDELRHDECQICYLKHCLNDTCRVENPIHVLWCKIKLYHVN